MEHSEESKACIISAIDNIYCGFEWDETPQGEKYWLRVIENLELLIGEENNNG